MKKIAQIFFVLLTSFCFSQSEYAEFNKMVESEMKSASRTMNVQVNPNTQNYDVTYHELRFTVDPNVFLTDGSGEERSSVVAQVKTDFTVTQATNTIVFDFKYSADPTFKYTISSVVSGVTSLLFVHQNTDELVITFPTTLAVGSTQSVTINYSGYPNNDAGAFTRDTHSGTPIIFTLSEPFGAKDWWPCKQDLNDKINSFDMYITAPSTFNSVSNGLQQSRIIAGANATTHFKHLYPIPAYLIVLNVTNYQIYNQQGGLGTLASPYFPIINYLYPETNTAATQTALAVTPTIINLYESLLEPYPFRNEKYGHAQFGWGGGMEHSTVSSMGSFGRDLIAHEMAHQWFGDKITCGTWKDIWLNEGITEYMSGLVRENLDGAAAFVSWKEGKIISITSFPTGATYLTDAEALNSNRIFSNRLTYNKGSMITHMLRWKMGDAAFFQALKSYLADPALAYGYAVTANFKSHLETAYGSSLSEFMNDWLYNQGYPTYDIVAQNWGAGQAKITVNQTQSHASVSFFEMPLEIRLTGSGGLTHDVVVNNTSNGEEFIVSVPFTVTGLVFDPNKHIISIDNIETLGNEIFDINKAVSLYPVPVENELNIQFPSNFTLYKVEVFNNLGQLLATDYKNTINTSQLSSGVHFLKIETSEGVFHKNFIKK
ncbi:M1 family aminopeptidase [Flavobacterium facile]|uniref:M1 family aminopeptidase n=1 Tax=Flavobacterium facile TaxID=2893174 RepID=UPI002E761B37|nr:M1 family aminopeptidase [Flavobacterium sp. T-12]